MISQTNMSLKYELCPVCSGFDRNHAKASHFDSASEMIPYTHRDREGF